MDETILFACKKEYVSDYFEIVLFGLKSPLMYASSTFNLRKSLKYLNSLKALNWRKFLNFASSTKYNNYMIISFISEEHPKPNEVEQIMILV